MDIINLIDHLPIHPTKRYKKRKVDSITGISMHHTATRPDATPEAIARYHIDHNDWPGIAYDYLIAADGTIYLCNPPEIINWHTGNNNIHNLGVCLIGNFETMFPKQEQVDALSWLVGELYEQFDKIKFENVDGHGTFPANQTKCPGKHLISLLEGMWWNEPTTAVPTMGIGMGVGHFPELNDIGRQVALLSTFKPSIIRFMDWLQMQLARPSSIHAMPLSFGQWQYEGGPWKDWAGVPVSTCLRVARELGARPWINVPNSLPLEDIEWFVINTMQMAELPPIFEFSNEVWNGGFTQQSECAKAWRGLGILDEQNDLMAALRYQAHVTDFIGRLVDGRADVVLAGQATNRWILEQLLEMMELTPSAIAIAPYIGKNVEEYSSAGFDQLADEIQTTMRQNVDDHLILAQNHGIDLITYEGFTHITGAHAAPMNRDDMMADIMQLYLDTLADIGVKDYVHYNAIGRYTDVDAWGAYEVDKDGKVTLRPQGIPLLR